MIVYENEQFLSIVTLNTKYTTKRNHAILLNPPFDGTTSRRDSHSMKLNFRRYSPLNREW